MTRLLLLLSFVVVAPLFLFFCSIYLAFISYHKNQALLPVEKSKVKGLAYAALPSSENIFSQEITQADGRSEIVKQFMLRYGSPLAKYAEEIVENADVYGIDFRFIPAIAMQESNLCKKIPEGSHNCWGFGIYGTNVTRFESYPKAIQTVTKTLAKEYKGKGLETPSAIMTKYTPSSNGSWAYGVIHFMNELE